jgi:hypothetical protein
LRESNQVWPKCHAPRLAIDTPAEPAIDFWRFSIECASAISLREHGALAAELGVDQTSLWRLNVGWSPRHQSYTFPMCKADHSVCGIRLRRPDGGKWAVKGSKQGLFLPLSFLVGEPLLVCEGPTDTAAMLSLGFDAVGRPSCNGGNDQLIDLVLGYHFETAVIIADSDGPGQRGARYLASRLVGYVREGVRIVTPPAKDAREWVRQGASRLDVLDAIEAAPVLQLRYGGMAVAR